MWLNITSTDTRPSGKYIRCDRHPRNAPWHGDALPQAGALLDGITVRREPLALSA